MKIDAFGTYNPITNFVFFIGAVVMGMFFIHPVSVCCSIVCSLIYYFWLKRLKGFRLLAYLVILFMVLTVLNPFFNTDGQIVLFWAFARPYTLESLIYGATLAGMVVSALCWFACYNCVMTSDKFIYMFGRITPSLSLIISMILRLIPHFRRKAAQIASARACIGLAGDSSAGLWERLRNGAVILNTMTGWSLENGIITADSMRARGYGSGKRSSFAVYRFDGANILCLAVLALLMAATIVCAAFGGMHAVFTPRIDLTWFGYPWMLAGNITYVLFMLTPMFVNVKESLTVSGGIRRAFDRRKAAEDAGI